VRLPALLLVPVYLAALAVALRDPSEHLIAGIVVLSALLWRLPAARSAISHALVRHPLRGRRSRRAAAPAMAPVAPV
jgi:hypothetical protein